ncbi:MAG: EAL domain-containing protein [Aphanocapsa sp. GSE-SYN-MK-11-07L]|nr:EAL domain-containing protein [Aphanocapsa sp. GSE-SYN-MK-11-07L]
MIQSSQGVVDAGVPGSLDVEQALDRLLGDGIDTSAKVAELERLAYLHQGLSTQGNLYSDDVAELESKVFSLLGIKKQAPVVPKTEVEQKPLIKVEAGVEPEPVAIAETPDPLLTEPLLEVEVAPPPPPVVITLESRLAVLNQLSQFGQKYLGGLLVVNYLQSARPSRPWMSQFQISRSGQITHAGEQVFGVEQQQDVQEWMTRFIKDCNGVIRNFAQMVKQADIQIDLPTPTVPPPVQPAKTDIDAEDLRRAIAQAELRVYYQPIVLLESLQIAGFEALVRWQHPQRGLLPPSQFIPLAESSGLVIDLDWWVLKKACTQVSQWQTQYSFLANLSISANLSCQQFVQPDLIQQVEAVLRETQINPHSLKLEITEGAIAADAGAVNQTLDQLRAMELQLSMDDFGTGYSSLGRLQDFPVDVLKIDRSFIQRLGINQGSTEIVRTIITLAHSFGMQVVAEGVETSQQLEVLRSLDCEYVQGYFCYQPLPTDQLENLFKTHPSIFISQT